MNIIFNNNNNNNIFILILGLMMLRFNKMMSLVKMSRLHSVGLQAIFRCKSIFRLCLFLDMVIIFQKLQDAICGWLVKLEKYMKFYFYNIGRSLFIDLRSKNRSVDYY